MYPRPIADAEPAVPTRSRLFVQSVVGSWHRIAAVSLCRSLALPPRELLDSLAPGIHHVDAAVVRDGHVVRESELAVLVAETAES